MKVLVEVQLIVINVMLFQISDNVLFYVSDLSEFFVTITVTQLYFIGPDLWDLAVEWSVVRQKNREIN